MKTANSAWAEGPMRYDDILVVIPARFKSSRLLGKPLKKIAGKTMLKRVYDRCEETNLDVMVATDDERIAEYCESERIDFIMTSPDCLTGTDRVAEVSDRLNYSGYINVQGDEPFVSPKDILAVEKEMQVGDKREVLCGMCRIDNLDHYYSPHVPKVIFAITLEDCATYLEPPYQLSKKTTPRQRMICGNRCASMVSRIGTSENLQTPTTNNL